MPRPILDQVKAALEEVRSGKLTSQQLERMRVNAGSKGGTEELVTAIDAELVKLAKAGKGKKGSADHTVAERRGRYVLMASAVDGEGRVLDPMLVPVAEAFSQHTSVQDLAVLKTQIRFYLKGRHMICAYAAKGGYWVGVVDETKVTDSTVQAWGQIGKVTRGKYYDNNSVILEFTDLADVPRALEATQFINS